MHGHDEEQADAVVIGSGFGGLGAALELARRGFRPLILERVGYPGGCASTFERGGYRFEAGATLFSGFAEGQLFRRFIDAGLIDVETVDLDPVIELRAPGFELPIGPDREAFRRRLLDDCADEDVRSRLHGFFREQGRVADLLWELLDRPEAMLPLGRGGLVTHLLALPRYAALLPIVGRTLLQRIERHGLGGHPRLKLVCDAMSQITLQASAAEVEAPQAMATLEYPFRGSVHVKGGIGELAEAMIRAIEERGGEIRYHDEVRALERREGDWIVRGRRSRLRSPLVFANLLPQALRDLAPAEDLEGLDWRARALEDGWGACMHYLVLREPNGAAQKPRHLQLVADPGRPLLEGNNVFVSISGTGEGTKEPGLRTATMSTHLAAARLRNASSEEQAAIVAEVQERMLATFERLAPEWSAGLENGHPGSPRTFRRFTGRPEGMVGGIPRRAGWRAYRGLLPCRPAPGLRLVGDTVFPGQSTLATAIGGIKAVEHALLGA